MSTFASCCRVPSQMNPVSPEIESELNWASKSEYDNSGGDKTYCDQCLMSCTIFKAPASLQYVYEHVLAETTH